MLLMCLLLTVQLYTFQCKKLIKPQIPQAENLQQPNEPIYQYHYVQQNQPPPVYEAPNIKDQYGNNQIIQNNDEISSRHHLQSLLASNPLLAALYLGSTLGIHPTVSGFNHPQHLPINPYVALLLSHYGRYVNVPQGRSARGLYGYAASNNYHNNQPFGTYKVYEDV